jgi:hypothetical protein
MAATTGHLKADWRLLWKLRKEERDREQQQGEGSTWQSRWKWWTSRGVHPRAPEVVCCRER